MGHPPKQVAEGVHLCTGTDVNWVLVEDGKDLLLVDGGWPGDTGAVEASIRAIGHQPRDVVAILLTHAHVDHMGAIGHFRATYGTPVQMDWKEVAHARRRYVESAGTADVLRRLYRPRVLPWALRIAAKGGLRDTRLSHAEPFPRAGALDLPGGPVPVAMHGHTSGHSAYYLPGHGAVLTGDALVTGHPWSSVRGPQLLGLPFDHAPGDARAALDALEALDGDLVLPGHGPVHEGPIAAAAAIARERRASGAGRSEP